MNKEIEYDPKFKNPLSLEEKIEIEKARFDEFYSAFGNHRYYQFAYITKEYFEVLYPEYFL